MAGPPPQHNMRPSYHGGPPNSMGTHLGGPPQQPPSGPTPTLNQLLQSSGGGTNPMGNGPTSGSNNVGSGGGANSGGAGHQRYPSTSGYEHTNSYPVPPHPLKTDSSQYPPAPSGWPPTQDRQGPPPPHVNNYHPPPQHMDQQSMYRQVTFIPLPLLHFTSSFDIYPNSATILPKLLAIKDPYHLKTWKTGCLGRDHVES